MTRCPYPQRAWLKAAAISGVVLSAALTSCATQAPPAAESQSPPPTEQPAAPAPTSAPAPSPSAMPPASPAIAPPVPPSPEVLAAFADETAQRFGLDPQYVRSVLARARIREATLTAMARPAETKPWREYRTIFLTPQRIDGGRAFLATHRDRLAKVEAEFGVPAEIIVAILGVETSWGRNTGSAPVLDALYTLAFNYPRTNLPERIARENQREAFFRDELAQLFALGQEAGLDITTLTGSYAGAMGWGQFMPSSYRLYSVDHDADGRRDLFNSLDDVFASVANYFVVKGGWMPGRPVMVPAAYTPGGLALPDETGEPILTLAALEQAGYRPLAPVPPDIGGAPIMLEGDAGNEYWLTFRNFRAIWSYNNSIRYATAVYQLGEAIAGRPFPQPTAPAPAPQTPPPTNPPAGATP